jgi:hypothetical protein
MIRITGKNARRNWKAHRLERRFRTSISNLAYPFISQNILTIPPRMPTTIRTSLGSWCRCDLMTKMMKNPRAIRIHLPAMVVRSNADNQPSDFTENPLCQRRPMALKAYANTAIPAMVRNKLYSLSSIFRPRPEESYCDCSRAGYDASTRPSRHRTVPPGSSWAVATRTGTGWLEPARLAIDGSPCKIRHFGGDR